MGNVHLGCKEYIATYDMCLCYFSLGFHEVSQYDKCLEKLIYGEEDGQE
jgi:hypothetical protein